MKNRDNPYFKWGLTAFFVLAACILLFVLLMKFSWIWGMLCSLVDALEPVFYGLAFGYLLCPIMNFVERLLLPRLSKLLRRERTACHLSRGCGIFVALGVLLLLIYALIAMILPQLTDSVMKLVLDLPDSYDRVAGWIGNLLADNPQLAEAADRLLSYLESWLSSEFLPNAQSYLLSLTSSMVNIVSGVLNLVIGLIVSVYVLASKDIFLAQAKKLLCALTPAKRANYLMNVARYAHKTFGGFLSGKLLDSLIIGILCFIGMSILRLPYSVLISVIVGVTNVIPFFGPYIGAVPSAFLILLVNPLQCLYFVLFILVLQQFDGNILGPHILGGATGLSGFWVVVAILLFGRLFGVVGMIIGVPAFAVLYTLISDAVDCGLRKRHLDPEGDFLNLQQVPLEPMEESSPAETSR